MSAETLRRAAALMREQHGPEHERHAMWVAMADWLDETAGWVTRYERGGEDTHWIERNFHRPFTVARIYLGETS